MDVNGCLSAEDTSSKDSVIRTVALIYAMEAEAAPVVEKLGLTQSDPPRIPSPAPCQVYSGKIKDMDIHVVWTGKCTKHLVDFVGTVPAALATYLTLEHLKPDVIISAGTAGGFKAQGGAIGDVYLSSAKMHHDRRIPIPGFEEYGLGLVASLPTPNMQEALKLKTGVVTSGNSLDYTDKCMAIMRKHGAAIKEMEAASIAWVCNLWKTPMFCVKAITDIVDGDRPTEEEFLENLHHAAQALREVVPRVLEFMAGKRLSEL